MNIHQVSAIYVQEQDRILVRINTRQGEELRLWFTRRLVLGLWPILNRAIAATTASAAPPEGVGMPSRDPQAQRLVDEFRRDAALRQADFATPYKSDPLTQRPLGQEPLLVSEVRISPQPNSSLRVEFQEKLAGMAAARGFQIELAGTLVFAFAHLLDRAIEQSQWRQVPEPAVADTRAGDAERGPDSGRPRYLN